ncbi:9012_t:CDS:2, partial [Scutellospora calospora]
PDIVAKTKHLLLEIEQENIQINAVVTDSVSAYQYNKVVSIASLHYEIKQAWRAKEISNSNIDFYQNDTSNSDNPNKSRMNESHKRNECYEEFDNFSESETHYNISSYKDMDIDIKDDKTDDQVNSEDL